MAFLRRSERLSPRAPAPAAPAPEHRPQPSEPPPPAREAAAAKPPPRAPMRWNFWALERVARGHPEAEELEYLVLPLRQFADAGQLPAEFDPLVRESFGDLLVG